MQTITDRPMEAWMLRAWSRITEPHADLTDPEQRRAARLLSGLLVSTLVLGAAALFLTFPAITAGEAGVDDILLVVIPLAIVAVAYGIGRTRYYSVATGIALGTFLGSTLAAAIYNPNEQLNFAFVLLPGLVGGLLLPGSRTMGVFVVTLVGVLVSPAMNPSIEIAVVTETAFLIVVVSSLMTLTAVLRENNRRTIKERSLALAGNKAELEKALQAADETNQRMQDLVGTLEQQGEERALLAELGDLLQAASSTEELATLLKEIACKLFPNERGDLYVLRASRDVLELIGGFDHGEAEQPPLSISHVDCMAMRLGRPYRYDRSRGGPKCAHLPAGALQMSLCVPMIAHGEVMGLFHICRAGANVSGSASGEDWLDHDRQTLAGDVAGLFGMAISNLQLRERLRYEAILDPLTGLFNRRYLDVTFDREIDRAIRAERPIGVIMFDLDHFKQLNDTHGHQAGDAVLRAIGEYLEVNVRGGDIACRYGGEEFAMVLPGADLESTKNRAHHLVAGLRNLEVEYSGRLIGPVTMSGGVAALPKHGSTAKGLLRLADQALYAAKADGRDRVVVAKEPTD